VAQERGRSANGTDVRIPEPWIVRSRLLKRLRSVQMVADEARAVLSVGVVACVANHRGNADVVFVSNRSRLFAC
jgi:hypothetical protein